MSGVRAWLERERVSHRDLTLDAALLAGRGERYAASRIALVALRACARTVLHSVELWLLSREIPFEFLIPIFAMRALPGLLTGLHWGALETLRRSVRSDVHEHRAERARATCEAWLSASGLAGAAVLLATVLYVSRAELPEDGPNGLYGAFALVSAFSFALELWSRTYHAGVFALGRVYKPWWALTLPDALELSCIVLLWSRLGPFSIHAGILLTASVRAVLGFIYTRRAFITRRLSVPHPFRLRTLKRITVREIMDALSHALMAAPFQLDRAFLIALLTAHVAEGQLPVAAPYYALRPLVGLAQSWARPFFADFVRIDVPGYGVLRLLFTRALARAGYVTAALSSLVVALASAWSFGMDGLLVGAWLAPLALVRARFSLDQVRAFAYGAHRRQLAITACLAAGIMLVHMLGASDRVLLVALVVLLLGAQRAQRHVDSAASEKRRRASGRMPVSAWLRSLSVMRESVSIHVAQIDVATARTQAVLETLARARPMLRSARVGRAWLLWWEPLKTELSAEELAHIVGGTMRRVARVQGNTGREALQEALRRRLLPSTLHEALTSAPVDPPMLRMEVAKQAPDAVVIDASGGDLGRLSVRTGRELSLLRRALIAAVREQHHVPSWAPWQAAVYAPSGELAVAFVWPSHVTGMADFRRRVLEASWRDAAELADVDVPAVAQAPLPATREAASR